ncbi:unnamed protein product [Brachionus calyciflorus]|uniref:Galectin domain-containing protein n=1 Tax=Brachionus calyciflorus TaxID=104777 RepID=A0A813ZW71_9BILA|nr:unnamed protein product [Brachionus calyciflorus]
MGKVDYFMVNLKKPNPIYYAGETLSGNLELRINTRMKINSIKMHVYGKARVWWQETEHYRSHGKSHSRTCTYSAYENYIESCLFFLVKQNDELYIEAGYYSYPFNILLPSNLPTSFEHRIGNIRYSLVATIDIPWAFDVHSVRSFSVLSHFDLNSMQALRQPMGVSGMKQFCCGPCKSDPVIISRPSFSVSISKTGFVPGETIFFSVKIDNKSNKKLDKITIYLNQKIAFHARCKSKSVYRTVAFLKCPKSIEKKSIEKWEDRFLIPSICSSSNGTCHIIQVAYDISFEFGSSGLSLNKNLRIPLVIGTIPLRSNENQSINYPFSFQASHFESEANTNMELKGEIVKSDVETYKPFYPYYDFTQLPS